MTTGTKTLLKHLAAHIGDDQKKGADLRRYCQICTGRVLYRSMLRKYLTLKGAPSADFLIAIIQWMICVDLIELHMDPTFKNGSPFRYAPGSKAVFKERSPAKKKAQTRSAKTN